MKILAVLLALVGLASLANADAPEIKIGAILPLTGPMAFAGVEVRDSISLALSDLGKTRRQYEVIFEDNGSGAMATATATNKLVTQDHANAILTLWPEAANVAAPITDRHEVLHYTIAWDPEIACSHCTREVGHCR